MADEELKALEEKAKAATPGPWEYDGHRIQGITPVPVDWADEPQKPSVIWDPFCFDRPAEDRAWVVAANPAAILSLIARLRASEARVRELEGRGKRCCARDTDGDGDCPWHPRRK